MAAHSGSTPRISLLGDNLDITPMTAVRRLGYRLAYRLLTVWWFVRRPDTRGVKLVLRDGEDVLFVRHAYGSRHEWEFPGGGMRRDETPVDAASRESLEELGIALREWTIIGHQEFKDRATAHLTCLVATYDGQPVRLNLNEIAEARWAPPHSPPLPLGDHATAFLALPALGRANVNVRG